jgi:hypothetical protein
MYRRGLDNDPVHENGWECSSDDEDEEKELADKAG